MSSQTDLDQFELGWLIGILEGEGYFGYERGTCRVIVGMSDEDTINRVALLFEKILGVDVNVIEEAQRQGRLDHAAMYRLNLTGQRARKIMRLVVRHMSFRRRQRIWQCLNGYVAPKVRQKVDLVGLGLIKEDTCLPN